MAVYKSTHCYPFMNNINPKTCYQDGNTEKEFQLLTCKVETSNKKVTGYSIRVLDENNNVVFPKRDELKISPIQELQTTDMTQKGLYEEFGVNSGLNGTFLKIPFFQSADAKLTYSYNAVYYTVNYKVDHIIYDRISPDMEETTLWENPRLWNLNTSTGNYRYAWDSSTPSMRVLKKRQAIKLDDEILAAGQIVLVFRSASSPSGYEPPDGFYKAIKIIENDEIVTELQPIEDWSLPLGTLVNITISRGKKFCGKTLSYLKEQSRTSVSFAQSDNFWTDVEDSGYAIGFVSTNLYKWEITLYQGEPSMLYDDVGSDIHIPYCPYDRVDVKDFDMMITTGTILGSNNNRVQIAYNDSFDSSRNPITDCDIPSLQEGVLVLQGKYMDFGNPDSNTSEPSDFSSMFNHQRSYVQSYDASLGHVYPIADSLDMETVNNYNYVQFFKQSLDEDKILDTDIVEFGIGKAVSMYYFSSDDPSTSISKSAFDALPINKRLYGFLNTGLRSASSYIANNIKPGQKLLLTNMTNKYQNGVYTIYYRDDVSTVVYLKRIAPYNTWGSYIGKIFYVKYFIDSNNSVSKINMESQAGSNPNSSLWNPDSINSGEANLIIIPETPILLFGNKISNNNYCDAYYSYNFTYTSWNASSVIDGVVCFAGMKVLSWKALPPYTERKYKIFTAVEGGTWSEEDFSGGYAFIKQGANYGKKVLYTLSTTPYNDTPTITWRLHTAKILKNTVDYTYISPFIDIQKNMKIKFMGNNFVTLDDTDNTQTQWLTVQNVNSSLYCVLHEKLTESSVLQSEVSAYNNTPWKYEIRSFFKSSDFNPFYCYNPPYLDLKKNNTIWNGTLNTVNQSIFNNEYIEDSDSDTFIEFVYEDLFPSYARPLKISAEYTSADGLSWESYRFVLLDKNGKILQDTGKKHDKELATTFYGLASDNDTNSSSVYYVSLYVEDEINNILNYNIKLHVQRGATVSSRFPFEAKYVCGLHAMQLSFNGATNVVASYRKGSQDILYTSKKEDGGIVYTNNKGFEVKNKNGVTGALLDYSQGSTITGDDAIPYSDYLSKGSKAGIPYYRSFMTNDTTQNISSDSVLSFPEQSNGEANNKLYFETSCALNSNYCGVIVDWFIEGGTDSSSIADLSMNEAGGTSDLSGYIKFTFRTADNFVNYSGTPSIEQINEKRDKLYLDITAYPTVSGQSAVTTSLEIENIDAFILNGDPSEHDYVRYYIQAKDDIGGLTESDIAQYEWLNFALTKDIYVKQYADGKFFGVPSSSSYFLGNLCLKDVSDIVSSQAFYWVENRPFLVQGCEDNEDFFISTNFQCKEENQNTHVDASSHLLQWPNTSGNYSEENYYWNDIMNQSLPIQWDDVNPQTASFAKELTTVDKHSTMKKKYHIVCKIDDVANLYTQLLSSSIQTAGVQSLTPDGVNEIQIKNSSTVFGKIYIKQEDGE